MSCRSGFLITEEDKKHILSMYNLINEAESGKVINISSQSYFDNGKWKNLNQQGGSELSKQMDEKVKPFLMNNKGSIVSVKITAGESQVTNVDNEVSPPKTVEVGYLAKKRAETMKNNLSVYLNDLYEKGAISSKPEFQEPEIKIGETPYKKGDNPNDPRYVKERFVNVELTLKSPEECVVGLTVEVIYDKQKNESFPCRGGHQCDEAKFNVKVNGVIIGVADLNNKVDSGSRYFKKVIDDSLAKQIMSNTQNNQLIISLQCLETKCHSSTPEVRITKGKNVLFWSCAPSLGERDDATEKTILVLDACGNTLKMGDKSKIAQGDNKIVKTFDVQKVTPNKSSRETLDVLVKNNKAKKFTNGVYELLYNYDFTGIGSYQKGDYLKPAN